MESQDRLRGDSELCETNCTSPVELSNDELDGISGGISFFLSGSIFERQNSFSQLGRRGATKGSSRVFSSAFQFGGSGFQSIDDVLKVISSLGNLFGRKN